MVAIQDIRVQLKDLTRFGPGLVGVFVGGTSGIGESTAREFVRYTSKPRVYLVGRSQEQADLLKTEFAGLNPGCQVNFIQSDVSLLRNVDKVCEEIQAKEDKINLLFLSAGMLTMKGRDETPEGLDKKFSLHYYSRMRFAHNLMPQLNRAADTSADEKQRPLASVVTVLAAGLEGAINMDDQSLKTTFSIRTCANQATSMNSLAVYTLSGLNPAVSFVHTSPGMVQTRITRNTGKWMQMAFNGLFAVAGRWGVPPQQSGERHLWAATNQEYGRDGNLLVGSDSGLVTSTLVTKMRQEGIAEKVWEHTKEVFEKITTVGRY